MAPILEAFHASELQSRINTLPTGKAHKSPVKDLKECTLKELLQYNCDLDGPKDDPKSKVVCKPVLRLFRQCANGLTVETTSWEDRFDGSTADGENSMK
ncbi:hypothetical protein SMMN14_03758 [Sphaerulina musiva]